MKVHRTASLTAVWRSMANIGYDSIKHVSMPMRFFAFILGRLDKNSVATISERTRLIDSDIRKLKPKYIVEIGAGYSSRRKKFSDIEFFELDLPYFQKFKADIIPFDIGKDKLDLKIKNALFIVEGVTMYLEERQVLSLLRQIKKYKGHILIDFFVRRNPPAKKNIREKIYKALFKRIIGRKHLFDYRIENFQEGINLLKRLGYKNAKRYDYGTLKSLDALFYAKL